MDALDNWSMIVVTIEIVTSLLGIVFNGLVIYKRQFAWTFIVSQHPASSYSALPWVIFSLVLWVFHFLLQGTLLRNGHLKLFEMAGCQAHTVMIFLLALVSLTHQAAISTGKYLTITKSLSKQSYFDTRKVRNVLDTSWIVSTGFSTISLIFQSKIKDRRWSKINGLDGSHKACLSDKQQPSVPNEKVYFGTVYSETCIKRTSY